MKYHTSPKKIGSILTKLRRWRENPAEMFGGINIVGCGDFHQFSPVSGTPVYKANWSEDWHGSVNACIFLQNDHRFEDDPTYGQILRRLRNGKQSGDDIHKNNTSWLGNDDVSLPTDGNICYACPITKIVMPSAHEYFLTL